jgi:hypothetical protein
MTPFNLAKYSKGFKRVHGREPNQKEAAAALRDHAKQFASPVKAASPVQKPAKPEPLTPAQKLDFEITKLEVKRDDSAKLLKEALERNRVLEKERSVLLGLDDYSPVPFTIEPKTSSGSSEAIAFMIGSDHHGEERVRLGDVSSENEYNLDIYHQRSEKFFQGGQRLWDIMRRDQKVPTLVLALLGDFITGSIHEDSAESNLLGPSDAIKNAEDHLISGIDFLLENTDVEQLIIPCHTGNHGRMTKVQRISTEQDNSLELIMYRNMARHYENNERVEFRIAPGYHSFLRVEGQGDDEREFLIRFHHGHHINYGGGIGGITIPVLKAIANWNTQSQYRNVNLDVFGHFHQFTNHGSFVCNGSLIGYNAYANSIKATFERPQQAFFMVSRKYMAKTMSTPIFVD